jgi:hypothetical protein
MRQGDWEEEYVPLTVAGPAPDCILRAGRGGRQGTALTVERLNKDDGLYIIERPLRLGAIDFLC